MMAATSPSEPQRWPRGKVRPLLGRPHIFFGPGLRHRFLRNGQALWRGWQVSGAGMLSAIVGPAVARPLFYLTDRKNVRARNGHHDPGDEHKNTVPRGAALPQVPDTDERVGRSLPTVAGLQPELEYSQKFRGLNFALHTCELTRLCHVASANYFLRSSAMKTRTPGPITAGEGENCWRAGEAAMG